MKEELQSLQVSTGWKVDWHTFYDFEPVEEYINYFAGDSLFMASNIIAGFLLCLEWRPEQDINGHFILRAIKISEPEQKQGEYESYWETPLVVKKTKIKSVAVDMLNVAMVKGLNELEKM